MGKSVSIGIHEPGVSVTGLVDGQAYAAFFRDVEAMGLDAIWIDGCIFHPAHLANSLVLLSWTAANTQRVQLGTTVLVLNLRQAPVVARQVSTLHHLSGDRVTLCVSISGRPEEYQALGAPMHPRVGVFTMV
jgi:alkanesulfonate monooxygenase SsuD/methylene tetrahydromethanopterin reductase-like flavin-dependent oxidoreductase (luciferase family)